FVRGSDLKAESEALAESVLNAAAEAGAVIPRVEILIGQNRGIDIRAIVAPDLSHVGENDQVQPFRIFVVHRPHGLTDLARKEDRVIAAEAVAPESATIFTSSVKRLVIERNLAAAFGFFQQRVSAQSQRGLVAAERDVGSSVEFCLQPTEIRKRVVGVD